MAIAPAPRRVWAYAIYGAFSLAAFAASLLAAPGIPGVLGGCLGIVMIAIAAVDIRYYIIPDALVAVAGGLGLVDALVVYGQLDSAAIAIAVLRGVALAIAFLALRWTYKYLRGREGIGLGDVKLAAVAGIWLDWLTIAIAIEIAALAALVVVAILALRGQRITGKTRLPFGCFLAPAIWLGWLLEVRILHPFW